MTITQAIERAVDGGYKDADAVERKVSGYWYFFSKNMNAQYIHRLSKEQIVLDPDFWRALGKAEGWAEHLCGVCRQEFTSKHFIDHSGTPSTPEWLYEMHRMIDALASGQSLEDFFKQI